MCCPSQETMLLLLRVGVACLVSALTLGNILAFGLFTEDIAASMGTTNLNAVAFIGEFQYICFLVSGILISPLHQSICSFATWMHPPSPKTEAEGWCLKTEDRYIQVLGAALWMSGYGGSVALTGNYVGFSLLLNLCASIGAGLLYWNIWVMLPTWTRGHQSFVTPLAALVIIAAPNLFVFFLSLCLWVILRMDNQLCANDSLWYCVYIWFFIASGLTLLTSAFGLVSADADETPPSKPKGGGLRKELPPLQPGHAHPVLWGFFVFMLSLFQATFYIPYLFVPIYTGSPPISGDESTVSFLVFFLSLGGVVGKCLGALLLAVGMHTLQHRSDDTKMLFRVNLYVLWTAVILIMCGVWVVCTGSLPGMKAFAFLFGLGAGGAMITQHMVLYHSDTWVSFGPADRVSIIAPIQGLGQLVSSAIVRWGLPAQIADATTNLSPVYLSIATSSALWLMSASLLAYLIFTWKGESQI